jgi:hypothetical protein
MCGRAGVVGGDCNPKVKEIHENTGFFQPMVVLTIAR